MTQTFRDARHTMREIYARASRSSRLSHSMQLASVNPRKNKKLTLDAERVKAFQDKHGIDCLPHAHSPRSRKPVTLPTITLPDIKD